MEFTLPRLFYIEIYPIKSYQYLSSIISAFLVRRQPIASFITTYASSFPKPTTQSKSSNNSHMYNVYVYFNYGIVGAQTPDHAAQSRAAKNALRANYPSAEITQTLPQIKLKFLGSIMLDQSDRELHDLKTKLSQNN